MNGHVLNQNQDMLKSQSPFPILNCSNTDGTRLNAALD